MNKWIELNFTIGCYRGIQNGNEKKREVIFFDIDFSKNINVKKITEFLFQYKSYPGRCIEIESIFSLESTGKKQKIIIPENLQKKLDEENIKEEKQYIENERESDRRFEG